MVLIIVAIFGSMFLTLNSISAISDRTFVIVSNNLNICFVFRTYFIILLETLLFLLFSFIEEIHVFIVPIIDDIFESINSLLISISDIEFNFFAILSINLIVLNMRLEYLTDFCFTFSVVIEFITKFATDNISDTLLTVVPLFIFTEERYSRFLAINVIIPIETIIVVTKPKDNIDSIIFAAPPRNPFNPESMICKIPRFSFLSPSGVLCVSILTPRHIAPIISRLVCITASALLLAISNSDKFIFAKSFNCNAIKRSILIVKNVNDTKINEKIDSTTEDAPPTKLNAAFFIQLSFFSVLPPPIILY